MRKLTKEIVEKLGLTEGDIVILRENNDMHMEKLWEEFGYMEVDEEECILSDFLDFPKGTHREEIWHWFDENHSKGVAFLMYG